MNNLWEEFKGLTESKTKLYISFYKFVGKTDSQFVDCACFWKEQEKQFGERNLN